MKSRITFRTFVLVFLLVVLSQSSLAWWNTSFQNRIQLGFDNSAQAENLTAFPVLVVLDSNRINYSQTQNAGEDLRFIDDDANTILPHEIELWNESGTSFIWVRIPQINLSSKLDYIHMYYNNVTVSDGQNATGVWNNDYEGVWHLQNDPSGSVPQANDSTSNNIDGNSSGSMTSSDLVNGQVDGSWFLDGIDDSAIMGNNIDKDGTENTSINVWVKFEETLSNTSSSFLKLNPNTSINVWVKFEETATGVRQGFVSKFDSGTVGYSLFWEGTVAGDPIRGNFRAGSGDSLLEGFTSTWDTSWHMYTMTYNGNRSSGGLRLYKDGVEQSTTIDSDNLVSSVSNSGNFSLGNSDGTANFFNGSLDETWISNTEWSSNWISATYKSMTDQFVLYGSQQSQSGLGSFNCYIGNTCVTNYTKLMGLQNESGGKENAHAQDVATGTYNFALCCTSTDPLLTLGTACTGGENFLRLSSTSNAHVQQSNYSTYSEQVCVNSSIGIPSCSYQSNNCTQVTAECLVTIFSSEGDTGTNSHVSSCGQYTTHVCCSFSNAAPTAPVLDYPINATTITNRTPSFNWTQSTDADGDPITYRIQVSLDSSFTTIIYDNETSLTNITPVSELGFNQYFWRVYANDSINWTVSTTVENFTVITLLALTLVNDSVDFGNLIPGGSNASDNDDPRPFHLRNDGNVEMNVSINATSMFSAVGLDNPNYQYKAANASETLSFNWSFSNVTYENMTGSAVEFIRLFNHSNGNDEAETDISITVPGAEPVGQKNSTVEFTGVVS